MASQLGPNDLGGNGLQRSRLGGGRDPFDGCAPAQALRQCILEADKHGGGSTAVSDPLIARALRLIREQPDSAWTVPRMAVAVSLSRSTFAERFRAATGETPMQNLTRYRMVRAAEYLRGTDAGVREIARLVGYDSEV